MKQIIHLRVNSRKDRVIHWVCLRVGGMKGKNPPRLTLRLKSGAITSLSLSLFFSAMPHGLGDHRYQTRDPTQWELGVLPLDYQGIPQSSNFSKVTSWKSTANLGDKWMSSSVPISDHKVKVSMDVGWRTNGLCERRSWHGDHPFRSPQQSQFGQLWFLAVKAVHKIWKWDLTCLPKNFQTS